MSRAGPLCGVRILEFAGMGPAPFATMILSDLGAEVLRIERTGSDVSTLQGVVGRGRASLVLDLKTERGREAALCLAARADILIEGYRPGVMERLGLGPEATLGRNPRLVYGRMTGWGQTGPLSQTAGHDINYIAVSGALAAMGSPGEPPPPPLNLVGDYGGGALYLAVGVLSALWEARQSGAGQVVDASIVDGAASLMTLFVSGRATGMTGDRGDNFLDGSAHYYRCYECADGSYVSIGAVEPHFYAALMDRLGVTDIELRTQARPSWSANSRRLEEIFRTRTRSDWCAQLEGLDLCFAPVLTLEEASTHRHMAERGVFTDSGGLVQPAPAPRFSRTPGKIQGPPPAYGEGGVEMARLWGAPDELLESLG